MELFSADTQRKYSGCVSQLQECAVFHHLGLFNEAICNYDYIWMYTRGLQLQFCSQVCSGCDTRVEEVSDVLMCMNICVCCLPVITCSNFF